MENNEELVEYIYLDARVEPLKLAGILGINVSLVYQNHQAGLFGPKPLIEQTYKEAIQNLRKGLVSSVELKIAKEETERQIKLKKIEEERIFKENKLKEQLRLNEIKHKETLALQEERRKEREERKASAPPPPPAFEDGDNMHPLMKKKITQEIKLNRVREVQSWIKVAEEKKAFLNSQELTNLLEPFIQVIKNGLIAISTDFPETNKQIESCMQNLYNFGQKIVEITNKEDEQFLHEMMEKDIDEDLIELAFIPEDFQ